VILLLINIFNKTLTLLFVKKLGNFINYSYIRLVRLKTMNAKVKKEIRKILRNHFGHANLSKIRTYLKSKSVNEYGCFFYEEKCGGGISVSYTSNSNCFARYIINIKGVGMTGQYGFTKKDITKAGKIRGCSGYHIF